MLELAEFHTTAVDDSAENLNPSPGVETTVSIRLRARWIRSTDGRLCMRWEGDPSPERYRPKSGRRPIA